MEYSHLGRDEITTRGEVTEASNISTNSKRYWIEPVKECKTASISSSWLLFESNAKESLVTRIKMHIGNLT